MSNGGPQSTITVGVFDDHEIFSCGVASILGDDPQVSSVIRSRGEVTDLDVAVTSLGAVDDSPPDCPLVVCTSADELSTSRSLGQRVAALLLRNEVTPDQLRGAVHAAAVGLRLRWQDDATAIVDDRGLSVLRLLAGGAGTNEISAELGYSERTIKATIQQVEHALGARTRPHAVALAIRAGLI